VSVNPFLLVFLGGVYTFAGLKPWHIYGYLAPHLIYHMISLHVTCLSPLPCAGEVERVVRELGITWKQSPRELLATADANNDEVPHPLLP
jgi:hypothetical protein